MKRLATVAFCAAALLAQTKRPVRKAATPKPTTIAGYSTLTLDPANPHYFRFRGRTTAFITSGEHYGAVLNTKFDIPKYLDTLAENHLNLTRIFNGAYLEPVDSTVANIPNNTLAPAPANYQSPWLRVAGEGTARFDLSKFDDRYFARLRSFITEAGKRNIAVEVTLFSVIYGSGKGGWGSWSILPMNPANNIGGIGPKAWDRFTTMDNPALIAAQDALVKRTVIELNGFDNVYYEICNEPYFSGATAKETEAWTNHLIATVKDAEAKLPNQHLIAENIANGSATVKSPNPAISIYNFHYATPPATVALNWGLKKPVAFDETSARCSAADRRKEAWAFLFAGGAVYNNLDPSFTDTNIPPDACAEIRYQLGILQTFVHRFELQFLQPDQTTLRQWPLGSGDAYVLSEPGRTYGVYLKSNGGAKTRQSMLVLDLPAGRYQIDWLNPRTGDNDKADPLDHKGGLVRVLTPDYTEDLALRLAKIEGPPKPIGK